MNDETHIVTSSCRRVIMDSNMVCDECRKHLPPSIQVLLAVDFTSKNKGEEGPPCKQCIKGIFCSYKCMSEYNERGAAASG